MTTRVLTVHGLARSPLSMVWLARALRRAGYPTEHFGYLAFAESYDRIVRRLRARMRTVAARSRYAVVAHSLGGLLVREALGDATVSLPYRVVMLGTPNRRSRMAEWAIRFPLWRWVVGEAGRRLADPAFYETVHPLAAPYTLVAGTRGLRSGWLPLGGLVNDGLVALEETQLTPDDSVIALPAGHSFMMNRRAVQQAVLQALRERASSTP